MSSNVDHALNMWIRVMALIFAIWLSNSSLTFSINSSGKLRFCIVESAHNSKAVRRTCTKFAEDHAPVECLVVNDRINCLRRLTLGDAEFGVFEPEDLVAYSSAYPESHILITHELRFNVDRKADFEMVVLASKKIESLSDLAGKKFCHPGLDSPDSDWTRIFANYLQSWIIPKKCEPDATLLENDIASWSEYFESACIAGPWSFDAKVDSQLKARYRNLCGLCDNPNGCYSGDKYHGPEGTLLCLTDNVGDVAWIKLDDAIRHFQALDINNSSYNYVCPDGLVRPVTSGRPCIWISKPWPVIAAQRDVAATVSELINSLNKRTFPWQNKLLELMEAYHVAPVATDALKTPEDYVRQFNGFSSAYSRWSCRPSRRVKWCVASNLEDRKCQWMRDAAAAYGIEPTISCHQHPSRDDCIEAVQTDACDLFIVKPEEAMEAHEQNLTSLFEVMPKNTADLNKIAVLVKRNSHFFSLDDLKGTRACFTSRQSIGWNAIKAVMKNRTSDLHWNCPKAMNRFFKEIIFAESTDNKNKNLDLTANTYDCLTSGIGDVAFISFHSNNNSYLLNDNLRSICVTEISQLDSKECFLTWTSLGSVMVNVNINAVRRRELETMLMQLNAWFGSRFINQSPAFSLYGLYDVHEGVIFHEQAQNLQENTDHIRLPRSYTNILEQLQNSTLESSVCNNANQNTITKTIIILTPLILANFFYQQIM